MGKIKQLESRSDLLSCWVEKGASIDSLEVKNIKHYGDAVDVVDLIVDLGAGYTEKARYNIYEILYSPESNFFEVIFGKSEVCYNCGKVSCGCDPYEHPMIEVWRHRKLCCVSTPDPLQYLLDNLNETTSF